MKALTTENIPSRRVDTCYALKNVDFDAYLIFCMQYSDESLFMCVRLASTASRRNIVFLFTADFAELRKINRMRSTYKSHQTLQHYRTRPTMCGLECSKCQTLN